MVDGIEIEIWSQPKPNCSVPDFPLWSNTGSVGFRTEQGLAICATQALNETKCFEYKQHQWVHFPSLTTPRIHASAINVNRHQTLIIGGYNINNSSYPIPNRMKSTEVVSSSGAEKGKDFPVTISNSCVIKINSTCALVIAGVQDGMYSTSTWYVDLPSLQFTPGLSIKTRRYGHGCATFHLGGKVFGVVAGGLNYDDLVSSTEIIDLDENSPTSWTEGMQEKATIVYL